MDELEGLLAAATVAAASAAAESGEEDSAVAEWVAEVTEEEVTEVAALASNTRSTLDGKWHRGWLQWRQCCCTTWHRTCQCLSCKKNC